MIRIILYLTAFIIANFLVLFFGKYGLLLSSLFLIPFDFVMRCFFHENWKGKELILKLGLIVLSASVFTYLINFNAQNIAIGSAGGFISAQIFAGIFYQLFINKSYFFKVNGSDAVGILVDSIVFQILAFGSLNIYIMLSQFILKIIGGLFWYWILFVKFNFQSK
jgi:uncharacterized PurR-regulated membrane protein YhhQ (DUF165 family)